MRALFDILSFPKRFFSPANVPRMARPTYVQELKAFSHYYVAVSLVEGAIVGLLAKKVFDVNDFQLTLITSAPMFANLTSFMWEHLALGRSKVAMICRLLTMILLGICLVAFLPISPMGRWGLTGLIVSIRCLIAGVVTIRSVIWRHNYPKHMRSQITGRTTVVVQIILLIAPVVFSFYIDYDENMFRAIYPLGAVVGVFGVIHFSKIRMRREAELLEYERLHLEKGDTKSVWPGSRMLEVLKSDHLYRKYLVCQFMAGVSNMMVEPVFIKVIAERTQGMRFDMVASVGIAHTLPVMIAMLMTPLWAIYLDRVHVTRFRVRQSWLWFVGQGVIAIGVLWAETVWGALLYFAIARFILGVARGGGMLAWNLGHLDFAKRELVAVYMAIHVTLTGVRGAIAPLVGMGLYVGWGALVVDGEVWIPAFDGIGGYVFFVAGCFGLLSAFGYYRLEKRMIKEGYETTYRRDG